MGNTNPKQSEGEAMTSHRREKSFKKVKKITNLNIPLTTTTPNLNNDPIKSTRDPLEIKKLFDKYAHHSRAPPSVVTTFTVDLPGHPAAKIERAGTILVTKPPAKRSRPFKSLQNLVTDRSPVPSPSTNPNDNFNGDNFVVILGTHIYSSQNGPKVPAKKEASSSQTSPPSYQSTSWFSGHCDEKDENFMETIIRETFEESAGLVALTLDHVQEALEEKRFFYSPRHKILTIIVINDGTPIISHPNHAGRHGGGAGGGGGYRLTEFNTAVQQLSEQNDYLPNTISSSMLEMEAYHAVKLTEFVKLVRRMWMVVGGGGENKFNFEETSNQKKNRFDPEVYQVKSVDGKTLRIQHSYAACLAAPEAERAFNFIVNHSGQ